MKPTLLLSHGAPTLALSHAPAADFLRGLPGLLPRRPTAIIVASAHWEAHEPTLNAVTRTTTILDFGGFPAPLYALRYGAPGHGLAPKHFGKVLGRKATRPLKRGERLVWDMMGDEDS